MIFVDDACIASIVTFALLAVMRARGAHGSLAERIVLASFLAGMPLIYIGGAHVESRGSLALELAALPFFALLAALGVWRWPRLIGIGILLHGVGWDSWHAFLDDADAAVPRWYAVACLVVDIALGLYALSAPPAVARRASGAHRPRT